MGAQAPLVNILLSISSLSYGAYEGYEGKCYVGVRCVQLCCRDDWLEGQGRQGRRGGLGSSCGRGTEEERIFQARRRVEPKVEEETCHASSQRRQSFYQGALRLQGQASFKNCEGLPHEEAQGDDQLREALWQRGELLDISVLVFFAVVGGLSRLISGAMYSWQAP